jgi:uncharacterized protein (TIGR03067 family)
MKPRILIVLAFSLVLGADKTTGDIKRELDKLGGKWIPVAIEVNGEKLPEEFVKEISLVIKGNKITTKGDFPQSDKYGTITVTIDPSAKPKTIDFQPAEGGKEAMLEGIYEIDGDYWKICLNLTAKERPTKLESKEGSDFVLVTLKRAKPE